MGVYGYCNECKLELSPSNYKFNRGKKLCLNCYDKIVNKVKVLDNQRKKLEDYICKLFKLGELSLPYTQQIDKFIKDFNFTSKGIEATLYYFYELMGNDIANDRYLGIVPRVYEEARTYFREQGQINKKNQDFIETNEKTVVKIRKPKGELPMKSSIENWE